MKKARKVGKNRNVILRVAVVALSVYFVVSLCITLSEIVAKEKELAEIERETIEINLKNEVLVEQQKDPQLHLEQDAREKGMAKPGESVFIETAND